jgi:hypothetical protein
MLVRNIGSTLESSEQGKSYMQQFANRMKDLAAHDYGKRIKFAIQDVLDLRSNNWQERVLKEKMKTKDQIRKDALVEARAQMRGAQNPFATVETAGQRPAYISAVMQKQDEIQAKQKREAQSAQAKREKGDGESASLSRLQKALAYFYSDLDDGPLIEDWKKVQASESEITKVVKELVETGFSNAKKAGSTVQAIIALLKANCLPWRVLESELSKQIPFLTDLKLDNPQADEFYQDIAVGLLTEPVPVTNLESAFKPIQQLDDPDYGFEVLLGVLKKVKTVKGLPGLKSALKQMKQVPLALKKLDGKDGNEALHKLLRDRGLLRDVGEVIIKVEAKFEKNDFSEEAFMQCVKETYGDNTPEDLQSDEFLMRFIEVWIKHSKECKTGQGWQERAACSAKMFANPYLGLVQTDSTPSTAFMKRQQLVLEAVAHGASSLNPSEVVYLLQAMFDTGMLADAVIFNWSNDVGAADSEDKKRVAEAIRKIAEE